MAEELSDILDRELVLDEQLKILWAQIEKEWDLNGISELFNDLQANYFLMLEEQGLLKSQITALSAKAA